MSPDLIRTLSGLRTKALRKQVWFCALTAQERLLAGLIRKHVKIVKNATLATVIAKIVAKLMYAIKNSFLDRIEKLGRPILEAMSEGASRCGNQKAREWVQNLNYIRYVGLMAYYDPMRRK